VVQREPEWPIGPICRHSSCAPVRRCERPANYRGRTRVGRTTVSSCLQSLTTTRAPSLPRTPRSRSLAFGLRSRPFFLFRNPSIPEGFSLLRCSPLGLGGASSRIKLPPIDMLRFGHRGRCEGEDVFARTMDPDVDVAKSCCRFREWVYLVSWSRSAAGVAYPCEEAMLAGMTESAKAEGVDVGDILGENVEDRVEFSVFAPDVLFVSLF